MARLTLDGEIIVHAHILDNTDGTYSCSYVPDRVAQNQLLQVSVNGARARGSPFQPHITAGSIVASQCTASGSNLYDAVAGRPICFQVQARDKNGNGLSTGSEEFTLHLTGTEAACEEFNETFRRVSSYASSVDRGDGSYEITWSVNLPGEYALAVTLDRTPIRGSPFRCFVSSPFVRPPQTILHALIEPSQEAVDNLVALPDASVRGMSTTLVDGQLIVASTMLQNRNVSTRHPSMHCGQFHAQYAHEKQYVKQIAGGVPLCRWRGALMPDYRADPDAKGVHNLAGADGAVYMLSQSMGSLAPIDRIRRASLLGGGEATAPVSFTDLRNKGSRPRVVDGFCSLFSSAVPSAVLQPATAEEGIGSGEGAEGGAPATDVAGKDVAEEEASSAPSSEAIWLFGGSDELGNLVGETCRYDVAEQQWSHVQEGVLDHRPPHRIRPTCTHIAPCMRSSRAPPADPSPSLGSAATRSQ